MNKKGIMNQTISIFVLILLIVVISGFTFWFVSTFKIQIANTTTESASVVNETGAYINEAGYTLAQASVQGFSNPSITALYNATDDSPILVGNVSVSSTGVVTNASVTNWADVIISYNYNYIEGNAYKAINSTESAGLSIIDLLPMIFLALGFLIILTVLIRILLPMLNLGRAFGGGNGF